MKQLPVSEDMKQKIAPFFNEETQRYDISAIRDAQPPRARFSGIFDGFGDDDQEFEHTMLSAAQQLNEELDATNIAPSNVKSTYVRYNAEYIGVTDADRKEAGFEQHKVETLDSYMAAGDGGLPTEYVYHWFDKQGNRQDIDFVNQATIEHVLKSRDGMPDKQASYRAHFGAEWSVFKMNVQFNLKAVIAKIQSLPLEQTKKYGWYSNNVVYSGKLNDNPVTITRTIDITRGIAIYYLNIGFGGATCHYEPIDALASTSFKQWIQVND